MSENPESGAAASTWERDSTAKGFPEEAPVFISYSSRNRLAADAVCQGLEARGIGCWMAPRDILPGSEWSQAIIEGINNARVLLLLLSPASAASQQVRREVERAQVKNAALVSLRIEPATATQSDALDSYLSRGHHIEALPLEGQPPISTDKLDDLATLVGDLLAHRRPASRYSNAATLGTATASAVARSAAEVQVLAEPEAERAASTKAPYASTPLPRGVETALPSTTHTAKSSVVAGREFKNSPDAQAPAGWNWGAFLMTTRWCQVYGGFPVPLSMLGSCFLYGALLWAVVGDEGAISAPLWWVVLGLGLAPRVLVALRCDGAEWRKLPPSRRNAQERAEFAARQRVWARRGLISWGVLAALGVAGARTPQGRAVAQQGRQVLESRVVRPLRGLLKRS